MAIQHLEDAKQLREQGKRLGRAGLSQRVIHLVEEFDGSYKGAMYLAGALKAIAIAAKYDGYWSEKVMAGYHRELYDITEFTAVDIEAATEKEIEPVGQVRLTKHIFQN